MVKTSPPTSPVFRPGFWRNINKLSKVDGRGKIMKNTIGYICNDFDLKNNRIKDYCEAHPDLELADIIVDQNNSPNDLDRTGFQNLISLIKKQKIQAIVVVDLTDLSKKIPRILSIISEIISRGIEFHCINFSLDSGEISSRQVFEFIVELNKIQKDDNEVGDKISAILEKRKKRGDHLGTPGLGYEVVKNPNESGPGKLVKNIDEFEIIQEIKTCRALGFSYPQTCQYLERQGYPTKRSANWYPSTVRYILKNPKFSHIEATEKLKGDLVEENVEENS